MKARLLLLLAVSIILVIFWATSENPVAGQGPVPTETPTPTRGEFPSNQLLPNDIMPPVGGSDQDNIGPIVPAEANKVVPIMFVPSDLTPNPLAPSVIDTRMQLVQRWYGEQLRGRTFSLEPVRMVRGMYPLSYYYGSCYPPTSSCAWGYELWTHIFDDLSNLGYPGRNDQILGVFLQTDGVAGVALGGDNRFLVALDPPAVFGDCFYPGCAIRVGEGGFAHELGHAFGLDHTADDPEGSPSISLMSYGFYRFPQCSLVNTSANPERDQLGASPFLNVSSSVQDGGFEDCLSHWSLSSGSASCTTAEQRSGLSALQFANIGQAYQVSQDVTAQAGQTYDFSGWLKISDQASSFNLLIQVLALSPSGSVLHTFDVGSYHAATSDWERTAASVTMPPGTGKARIEIHTPALGATVYVDDIDFHMPQGIPPAPVPMFYNDGDSVPTLQPVLKWSDVTSATYFRVQIAGSRTFGSLIADAVVSSPFYTVPSGLAYDTRYYWRVKAINGAGESEWSTIWSFIPRTASHYYNDEFETGTFGSAWSWVREDPSHWGFGGPLNRRGYGYLGITTQAGDLYNGWNNAKNLLLREMPPDDFEVSTTYDFWGDVSTEYQQGGLLIYQDDDNYMKLVRIYGDGHHLEFHVEVNGTLVFGSSIPIASPLLIKIARIGNTYTAYYSPDGFSWRRLGEPITVNWSNPRMGLAAYSLFDVEQVTAYFDWFRVTEPCFNLTLSISPPGGGTVTPSSGDCNGGTGYNPGDSVTLTASPNDNYAFSSWSGDVSGTDNPISLIMSSDKTVTADFAPLGQRVFLPIIQRPAVNLLPNGSFEDGSYSPGAAPTGWTRDIWDSPNATLTWDNSIHYDGSKSVRITATTPNDARWIQTLAVQPNTNYRLSGWIKTDSVTHVEGPVVAGATLGFYGTWEHTAGLFGTNDWTKVSLEFNSGSSTEITPACRLGFWSGTATGTMWCDDIWLERLP